MKDGEEAGPISDQVLRLLVQSGQLGPADYLWKEGMAEWQALSTIEEAGYSRPSFPPFPSPELPGQPRKSLPRQTLSKGAAIGGLLLLAIGCGLFAFAYTTSEELSQKDRRQELLEADLRDLDIAIRRETGVFRARQSAPPNDRTPVYVSVGLGAIFFALGVVCLSLGSIRSSSS